MSLATSKQLKVCNLNADMFVKLPTAEELNKQQALLEACAKKDTTSRYYLICSKALRAETEEQAQQKQKEV